MCLLGVVVVGRGFEVGGGGCGFTAGVEGGRFVVCVCVFPSREY